METRTETESVTRRHMLQILAALGVSAPVAAQIAAQSAPVVSEEALRSAATLLDGHFDKPRLVVARAALQRNLDQFQAVRDLDIPDAVEPPTIFMVKR